MDMKELNKMYYRLQMKCNELMYGLHHRIFETEWGWYNGHYYKNSSGEYERAEYPIPVITVNGFCDIEINLDHISLTSKRCRAETLNYAFEKFSGIPFEVFSIENYLDEDYYTHGTDITVFRNKIRKSQEKELGFSFLFDFDVGGDRIYEFVKLLRREGFCS